MSNHQLTQTNRIEIAILFRTGMSYRAIGKHIGCHHTTVSRELRRHTWSNPSGYLMAVLLPDKGAKSFEQAAKHCFAAITDRYGKTLTLDNGIEMGNYEAIERGTQLSVYFAHPYHSWERGSNENTNGLLRFYFPKKMSFKDITQQQLDAAVQEINTRPRKRLGYKTPSHVLKVSGAIRTRI
jgi:IS30 family transposase